MRELVEVIAKALVDHPEEVVVTETATDEKNVLIRLQVAQDDMGKVIGKKGCIAQSIRALAKAAASKEEKRVTVEIAE
ncbi:MAG: KH domain-containing protein [Lachnospiraceae bacterium]